MERLTCLESLAIYSKISMTGKDKIQVNALFSDWLSYTVVLGQFHNGFIARCNNIKGQTNHAKMGSFVVCCSIMPGFFCALWKKTQGRKKNLRFLSILVETQVKNQDFRVTLLNTPPKNSGPATKNSGFGSIADQ